MLNIQKKLFKKELTELLEKYKVSIDFRCGQNSDWHGIYDARLEITDNTNQAVLIFQDTYINSQEIKKSYSPKIKSC